ncbi:hypothetical protein [Chryseobacterium paridis]|uniref:DUF3828 domain-containing protein n=1 Tax=Chryseobacterium paridis TaxID=2800328 RepID=A0ABS1FRP6_9FLAO|nr:hypothetical protein [Chryseobacterium paridis]MBK1894934.1 hypothetical protein [Chryseobacterium paridis]
MEKLHKYCLSVLLVIICSNISAQSNHCSVENEAYKRLHEVYSQFFNSQDTKDCFLSERKKTTPCYAINHKQNAGDLIQISSQKQYNFTAHKYNSGGNLENRKYEQVLVNFEKENKVYRFVEGTYFKSKVSKIRNKDYLDIIS